MFVAGLSMCRAGRAELGLTAPRQCLNIIVFHSTVCRCEAVDSITGTRPWTKSVTMMMMMMQCVRSGSDMFNNADDQGQLGPNFNLSLTPDAAAAASLCASQVPPIWFH